MIKTIITSRKRRDLFFVERNSWTEDMDQATLFENMDAARLQVGVFSDSDLALCPVGQVLQFNLVGRSDLVKLD